jgi:Fe-S cluster assembly iron-binding protein IscA
MVHVTEQAKQEIRKALTAEGFDDPEIGLRISRLESGDYTLTPDSEKEGDLVVEHEGSKVMLLDEGVSQALEGKTIDRDEASDSPRLVIREG